MAFGVFAAFSNISRYSVANYYILGHFIKITISCPVIGYPGGQDGAIYR